MQQIINRYFYPQKAFAVAVSILPGLILGYIQANNFYFFACLLSISSIMPYQVIGLWTKRYFQTELLA